MSSLAGIEKYWEKNGQDYEFLNNSAPGWGLYIVNYPNIYIERWTDGDAGAKYPVVTNKGRILNDTTMLLEGVPFGRDTFYFHYLPIKPDSTNRFIK